MNIFRECLSNKCPSRRSLPALDSSATLPIPWTLKPLSRMDQPRLCLLQPFGFTSLALSSNSGQTPPPSQAWSLQMTSPCQPASQNRTILWRFTLNETADYVLFEMMDEFDAMETQRTNNNLWRCDARHFELRPSPRASGLVSPLGPCRPRVIQARLEPVFHVSPIGWCVKADRGKSGNWEKVRALPHPGVQGGVKRVPGLYPAIAVPASVQDRHSHFAPLASDNYPPPPATAQPACGRASEGVGVDHARGCQGHQGVIWGFHPLREVRVGQVPGECHVRDLLVVDVYPGVQDRWSTPRKHRGGARPAAIDIGGLRQVDGNVVWGPVHEVLRSGVGPHDVAPMPPPWLVLVEQAVQATVNHGPCTYIFLTVSSINGKLM